MPNRYEPIVIDAPSQEPVTATEAKLHCRVTGTELDSLFDIWIQTAREYIESQCGITLFQQTLELALDDWPWWKRYIELPRATPLIEVVSVNYTDSDEVEHLWDPGEYLADTDSLPGRVVLGYGKSWPAFTPRPVSAIRVRYTAGIYPGSGAISATAKEATLLAVGGMVANAEDEFIPERNIQSTVLLRRFNSCINKLRVPTEYAEI